MAAGEIDVDEGTGKKVATRTFTDTDAASKHLQRVELDNSAGEALPFNNGEYETVAASQTGQVLGGSGATGDFINHITVIPATTSPGAVTLIDGSTSIIVFAGGANSVSNLVPFAIPLGMKSKTGAWSITTGANVSAIGVGDFT